MNRPEFPKAAATVSRDLACLFGLPIDRIDMEQALEHVREAVRTRQRLFLSTPNLNFLVMSQKDAAFRESVLMSGLSVADGVSLVLLARLFGIALPGRLTGSELFERLALDPQGRPPIRVFFLGGPEGASEAATRRIEQHFPGVTCVGHDQAGFGPVESMSSQALMDKINACAPDFLVVALGARKGQEWIVRNQHRLNVPVISHLGAVINFMAGTVRRAPGWMRHSGLEWVWRIKEEPHLWRRYWDDGWMFLSLLVQHGISTALTERQARKLVHREGVVRAVQAQDGVVTLELSGHWGLDNIDLLRELVAAHDALTWHLDLTDVEWFDNHVLGLWSALHGNLLIRGGGGVQVVRAGAALVKHIRVAGAEYLLHEEQRNLVSLSA